MNLLFPASSNTQERMQSRLMNLAAAALFLYSAAYTLAPAVRLHSWDVSLHWHHWIGYLVWLGGCHFLYRQIRRRLPDCDPLLLPITALLSGWGLLTIWRLDENFGLRQTLWLAVSLAVIWFGLRLPNILLILRKYKYIWLTGGILLASMTFFFGVYPGGEGPHLWLNFFGIYLQPSEPLKLLLIIFLAAYLADRIPVTFNLWQLLAPTFILFAAAISILLIQRDLGTTTIFVVLYAVVIYLASGKRRMLLVSALFVASAGLIGYNLFNVIKVRVEAWLNPRADPSGNSYQIVQSILGVAAGGVFGRGFGLGSPGVIPVVHSDFIFSAIAEETGLTGTLILLLLFGLLTVRGLRTAMNAPNQYQRFLAAGLTTYIVTQAILIIGGNLRLLPLTGVTLPLMSYGGSSLLTILIAMFLLMLVSANGEQEPAPLARQTPYLFIGGVLLAGLGAIALSNGWWSVIRSADLLSRTDNPRRSITDYYARRGSLLDKNNTPINATNGEPGDLLRTYYYPALSAVTGYTSAAYGQAGLEASLDDYLRGLDGNPASMIWWYHLVYGQTPPGLDVRLSLDLELQQTVDDALDDHNGAVVLLDAESGEVLAMATHPTFDANNLEEQWSQWVSDPESPLINRAVQGLYPVGTALTPFLLAEFDANTLPDTPSDLTFLYEGQTWPCALINQADEITWQSLVQGGCPIALTTLGNSAGSLTLYDLYTGLGFTSEPDIPLEVASPEITIPSNAAAGELIGSGQARITPLQMALAVAALSNGGIRPAVRLANSVETPAAGWVSFPVNPSTNSGLSNVDFAVDTLTSSALPAWESLGWAVNGGQEITWYLAGTLPDWQGTRVALVIVLEEFNPLAAQEIGRTIMADAESME